MEKNDGEGGGDAPGEKPEDGGAKVRILVADDEARIRRSITRVLGAQGYEVTTADDGREAWERVASDDFDVVLTDIMMPALDGFELTERIRSDPRTRLTPVVLVTGLDATEDRIRGIDAGADDFITKPFDAHELSARVRSLAKMKRYTDELERAEIVIYALARAIEARDANTQGHCERLSVFAADLGHRLGMAREDVLALERGGIVHDIGKVAVPDSVLLKPGPLSDAEWELMRRHPTAGEEICRDLKAFQRVLPIIRHHHERGDGSGYPDGLEGSEIPPVAKVLQVVDVFDALTSTRPYRQALPREHAFSILREEVHQGWWDDEVVGTFEEMVLSDGDPPPPSRA